MKKIILLTIIASSISGCSSLWYGTSNVPEPVDRPTVDAPVVSSKVIWKKNLGGGGKDLRLNLSPVGDDAHIFAISADGLFYRISPKAGDEELEVDLKNNISNGLVGAGNVLIAGTENGDVVALSPEDGHVVWRTRLASQLAAPAAASEDKIVAKTIDGTLTAIDIQDGSILWQYVNSIPQYQLLGGSSPVIGGGVVISLGYNGYITVLTENSGLPVVEKRIALGDSGHEIGNMVDQIATPKIDGAVLFGSAYQNSVYAIDLKKGNTLWKNDNFNTAEDFSIDEQNIYLVTPEDKLIALSRESGKLVWSNDQFIGRKISPPVSLAGMTGFLDDEGYLYWVDSNSGKLISAKKVAGTGSYAEPLVLSNYIIWQLNDGKLIAVRVE